MNSQEMAKKLHSVAGRGCIAVTGSGIQGIDDQHVSVDEAKLIAKAALKRAQHLAQGDEGDEPLFGVGCTAAVATDRVRRGEDRAHIAWTNGIHSGGASIWFDKQVRSRADEDAVVSAIVLNSIAMALEIDERLDLYVLETERFDEFD